MESRNEEYYYSGSGFYEEGDAQVTAAFSESSPLPCSLPGCEAVRAMRYGAWWRLTGVSAGCDDHEAAQARLRQWYSRVVRLRHPGVTRMVAMTAAPCFAGDCVVEEYIDGAPLADALAAADRAIRRDLLRQLLSALAYCHSKGEAHGNLAAGGVVVSDRGVLKLVDFAIEPADIRDDIRDLGKILPLFGLPRCKRASRRCLEGKYASVDDVNKDLFPASSWGRRALWLLPLALVAAIVAGFLLGHRHAQTANAKVLAADSLPLPAIYFSDTVNLSLTGNYASTFSAVTQSNVFTIVDYVHSDIPGPIPESEAVDLGLSVRWAPFNVGCSRADQRVAGGFFVWCDTAGVAPYSNADAMWPASQPLTDIAGGERDRVRRLWGGRWRMPTRAEMEELRAHCLWTLVKRRGVTMGYSVRGTNGNTIFLPAAGKMRKNQKSSVGAEGYYWTSTPAADGTLRAKALQFDTVLLDSDLLYPIDMSFSVRPVLPKQ